MTRKMIMKEIWKDISNFEGMYQVSNKGRVRRLAHQDAYKRYDTPKICVRNVKEKILKPAITSDYFEVNLFAKGMSKYKRIHRIVAETFIPNPDSLPQVNHIDGDKFNNCVENLEWCTSQSNVRHSMATGLRKNPEKGVYRGPVRLECIQTQKKYNSIKEASDDLSVSYHYLSECIYKNKSCHGYNFKRIEDK